QVRGALGAACRRGHEQGDGGKPEQEFRPGHGGGLYHPVEGSINRADAGPLQNRHRQKPPGARVTRGLPLEGPEIRAVTGVDGPITLHHINRGDCLMHGRIGSRFPLFLLAAAGALMLPCCGGRAASRPVTSAEPPPVAEWEHPPTLGGPEPAARLDPPPPTLPPDRPVGCS